MTKSRFTENDAWLGNVVKEGKKKCFYVRTQIDTEINNERYDRGDDFNATATIEQMRQDAQKCLKEATIVAHVYLITTRLENAYDFPRLQEAVIGSAMELKRHALIVFLQSLLESVVTEKIERCKSKVGTTAIVSALGGAIPLPGVSIGVDAAAITFKVSHYRNKLFLDEDSLKGVHENFSINIDELKLTCREIQFTEDGMPMAVYANALGTVGKLALPVLGSALAVKLCLDDMKSILCKILDDLKGDALRISKEIIERLI
ncbi:T-cell-specific guanine nucleotide triphosphate-binding protein 2-like [Mya arenaria]|nr:T-cell-specific guanine nucleotide triphosphate-binding protein 2-like [Mya arenaria]